MKTYTFNNGHLESGILVTEKTTQANLGDFLACGNCVDFSIFYPERIVPQSSSQAFAFGFNQTSLVTIVDQYASSDGSAFCLLKHVDADSIKVTCQAYVLAVSTDPDIESNVSLIRISEGGYIELCEKVTALGDMLPVWKIYNSMGVLYCQRLHWDAPWRVDGQYLFARLDAASLVRISLDFLNHNSVESKLELLSDRGWVQIAARWQTPDYEFLKGNGSEHHCINKSRMAARCALARELTQHAAFLYQGRLSDPSVPL
ncbi:MAG: hypothetical protein Q8T09_08185 [Candidatus Melainabacteria bacterium]|nr:hypothetical protein [Candidatus Melainabacteria bacterium]